MISVYKLTYETFVTLMMIAKKIDATDVRSLPRGNHFIRNCRGCT